MTKEEKDIHKAFSDYLTAYFVERNFEKTLSFLSNNFTVVGTGSDEFTTNLVDAKNLFQRDIEQAPNKCEISNKELTVDIVSNTTALLLSNFQLRTIIDEEVLFIDNMRASVFYEKENSRWLIRHKHISIPYAGQSSNESYPIKDIEERYQVFMENASDSFYLSDMRGRFVDVNKAACSGLGYTRKEFLNLAITDVDINFSSEKLSEIHKNIIENKRVTVESIHKQKNGETFPVEIRVNLIEINGQQLFLSIARNISERIEAEEALRKSEAHIKAVIGSLRETLIITLDENGKHLSAWGSPELDERYGIRVESIVGKTFEDILPPDIAQYRTKNLKHIFESGESHTEEFQAVYPTGKFWHDISLSPAFDSSGKVMFVVGFIRDITERNQAEVALRESEEKFRSIFENHSAIKLTIEPESGNIVNANKAATEFYGWSLDKLKTMNVSQINTLPPKMIQIEINNAMINGKNYFEFKHHKADGSICDVEVYSSIVEHQNEEFLYSIIHDITDKKKAENTLKESEELYRSVFEYSPLGIFHFNINGVITDCNNEFVKIIGSSRELLIGLNMPKELKDKKMIDAIWDTVKNGFGYYDNDYESVTAQKTTPLIIHFNGIYDSNDKIIGGVGLIEDVTIRKQDEKLQKALFSISEEASKTSTVDEFYKSLHEIIETLMPVKNIFIAIHNIENDKVKFPYFFDKHDPSPVERTYSNGLTEYVLERKKSQILKGENNIRKKGIIKKYNSFPKAWIGIYLEFEGKYRGVLALQDYENENAYTKEDVKVLQFVSEQIIKVIDKRYADANLRKMVKKLSKAKEELELINKNKDRFFSIISHDLRSPFMALMGISQMISEDMSRMTLEEINEMTRTIHHSTQNLNKLIENLLSWSRLQMGTFEVSPRELNLKEVSSNVVNILKLSANEKNIVIQNNVTEANLFADEDCTKTILRNLINNAIKFTERDGVIKLSSKADNSFVEISVEDNGVGISKTTLKKLFSITEKVSEIGTEKEVGTGLGLILCKELVEKNNGKIWVESKLGNGSKFTFTLPTESKK